MFRALGSEVEVFIRGPGLLRGFDKEVGPICKVGSQVAPMVRALGAEAEVYIQGRGLLFARGTPSHCCASCGPVHRALVTKSLRAKDHGDVLLSRCADGGVCDERVQAQGHQHPPVHLALEDREE